MSSSKLSPRQKMINMMYLVLTALLAMNVSKEVLNAFKIVGKGIETSNQSIQSRNIDYYNSFEKLKVEDQTAKGMQMYALSTQTKKMTEDALFYISSLQEVIKEKSGTVEEEGELNFKSPDDLNTGTKLLSAETNGRIEGEELRLKLNSLRMEYLEVIEKGNQTLKGSEEFVDYKNIYASILPLAEQDAELLGLGKEKKTWADFNFGNVPVIASDVILEKLKNDIINTESQVLEYLLEQANGDVINFDVLEARVIAPKSYLAAGKTYEADIFISAASSNTRIEVFIGSLDKNFFGEQKQVFVSDEELPFIGNFTQIPVENGKANFSEVAKGVGNKNYEGIVRLKKPTGGFELYPFYADYEVAPPSGMSVSATKMNVLYIGIDNPIQIAVNGAKSDSDVKASISQGSITKNGSGKYTAQVSTPGIATIQVSANVNDKQESFAPMEFRVLSIPDPKISLCGIILKSKMTKSEVLACNGLIAQNPEFVFETRFDVLSFEVIVNSPTDGVKRESNSGPIYNSNVQNMLNGLKKKDILVFDNIMVKDPAKKNRKISGSIYIEIV